VGGEKLRNKTLSFHTCILVSASPQQCQGAAERGRSTSWDWGVAVTEGQVGKGLD